MPVQNHLSDGVQDENGPHILQVVYSNSSKDRTVSVRHVRGEGQLSQIRAKGFGLELPFNLVYVPLCGFTEPAVRHRRGNPLH